MAAFDEAKLFVRNIPDEAGEQALSDYFAKYGEVVRSVVLRDKSTGNAKGFGFVSFATAEGADKALQDGRQHVLLGRTVEIRKATRRPDQHQHGNSQSNIGTHKGNGYTSNNNGIDGDIQLSNKKVFVGGLPPTLTDEELKNYFEKYGKIVDAAVIYDNVTHRPRGFGFVSFDSEEAAEIVVQKNFHELQGKQVEAKKAIPKGVVIGEKRAYGYHYSPRMSNGRGPSYGGYGPGMNSPHIPTYGVYQNFYGPSSQYGYGGGFPYGPAWYGNPYYVWPYGSVAYGGPMAPPRSPWNGYGMVEARRSPMPYNGPPVDSGYANGGAGVGGYMYSGAVAGSSDWKDQMGRNDRELKSGALHATSLTEEDSYGSDESSSHSGQSGQDIKKR